MPNNGLLWDPEAIEWNLTSTLNSASGSGSGTLAKSHSANAQTEWVPNAINVNTGIYLEVSSSDDGAGTTAWQAKYDGPGAPFGGYIVTGTTFLSSVSIIARAIGVKLYCKLTGSLFRTLWTGMEIYVNGVYQVTLSGIDVTSNGTGPNYVNYIGTPLIATGTCSASKVFTPPTYDPCNPTAMQYMVQADATSTINAGWRFKTGGTWYTLPCEVWSHSIPSGGGACPYNLSFSNEVTVTDTNSIEIHCYSYTKSQLTYDNTRALYQRVIGECVGESGGTVVYDQIVRAYCANPCTGVYGDGYVDAYYLETWTEGHGGSARAIPNLERAIYRINSDYAALWRRFHFPEVRGTASRTCTIGATTVTTGGAYTVYNDLGTDYLGLVRNAANAIEDCFPATIYTQSTVSKNKAYTKSWSYPTNNVCLCPPPSVPIPSCPEGQVLSWSCINQPIVDTPANQSESITNQFPSYVGTLSTYQGHADMLMRYTGSWVNPHWALAYHRQDWDVDSVPTDNDLYWSTIKEQYLYNSALTSPPRTRNSMIASPLYVDNGNQPFQDAFFNKFRWIGISRWKVLNASPPSTLTLSTTRPGKWNATDCSISLGAGGITVSSFTKTSGLVDLQFGDWTADPYLLLLRASALTVNWSTTNVKSIKVVLIGVDNVTTPIGSVPNTYDLPAGWQKKYAGSWAIDNGASLVFDIGVDSRAEGISSTIMGNPETTVGFQLACQQQYARIRFVVTPINPANPVTINWPQFSLEHTHPMMYWENSKYLTMLWHNTCAIRWGNLLWYSPSLGFMDPPITAGMDLPNTVIDALAYYYRIVLGAGGSSLASTITTDLSSLYDAYEGQSISVVDKFSNSFILPKGNGHDLRFALVNSFSEVPPMACFPWRKRATTTWLATGNYAQVVYDHCQDGRYIISETTEPAKLQTSAGVDSGSFLSPPEPGWSIWKFNPVLYNDELNWKVVSDSTSPPVTYALVRPWHGWFCNLAEKLPGRNVWNGIYRFDPQLGVSWISADPTVGNSCRWYGSEFSVPQPNVTPGVNQIWSTNTSISAIANAKAVSFGRDIRTWRLYALVEKYRLGIFSTYSDDEGATWTTLTSLGAGKMPFIWGDSFGLIQCWMDDSVNPPIAKGQYRHPGDTAWSSTFTFKDSGGNNIYIADGGMCNVTPANDMQDRLVWSPILYGDTTPTTFFSVDYGQTWQPL
jgi:hypothetical protein